jgi:aspartyl-tRNA(Asn)/glutamyl-tRNA(Gln) amidotransferase subunit A
MLAIIAGYDASDESCVDRPVSDYLSALTGDLRGVRVGVERAHHFPDGADPALSGCFNTAVDALADLGADLVEVKLPHYEETTTAAMVTMASEALAYHRSDLQARWEDYFAGTRQMLALGALVSAADFVQAQRTRRVAQEKLQTVFADVDVVVGPTTAIGAPQYSSVAPDKIFSLMDLMFTAYWDATGNPALVVPMGFTAAGLPLSLQIAGRPFEESTVLKVGDAYQSTTNWHLQVAPLALAAARR